MSKIALITGATSGIGEATAHAFAADGFDLIITGRRVALLSALEKDLESKYGIKVLALSFDVRNLNQVEQYLGTLPKPWNEIDVLVNNAGLAVGLQPVQQGMFDDW